MSATLLTPQRRVTLSRRSLHLAYVTAGYNLVEGIVALVAGVRASSNALIAFGLDSFVEVLSAAVLIWQFHARVPEDRERLALRLIGVSFLVLAGWVTIDAVSSVVTGNDPDASPVGIGLAMASLIVMPLLVWAKNRTGRELGSASVLADSLQTLLCTYLSAVLLVGLLVNALWGWSWADALVALVIAAVAVREGIGAWRGDTCCEPVTGSEEAPSASAHPDVDVKEPCGCCR